MKAPRKSRPIVDRLICLVVFVLLLCLATSAKADSAPPWMEGAWDLCRREPVECAPYGDNEPEKVELTDRAFEQLNAVNNAVNDEIEYVTDPDHFHVPELWTYPTDGKGDCEDFALEKRRRLIALGWPRRALLIGIANVRSANWAGHAVLIARTTSGDLVLDLATNYATVRSILVTPDYAYTWQQSQKDPHDFVRVDQSLKPTDSRCYTAGRYQAMSEGAWC